MSADLGSVFDNVSLEILVNKLHYYSGRKYTVDYDLIPDWQAPVHQDPM